MPPRKSYLRKNKNVEKQTPMDPTDPLGENVLLMLNLGLLSKWQPNLWLAAHANMKFMAHINLNVGMTVTRV